MSNRNSAALQNEKEIVCNASCDPNAFVVLYEYYFPKIYNYVRYRVANPDTADDLTSEIFERVLKKLDSYSPEKGKFSSWLFTIAHNTVINYFRNQKHQLSVSIEKAGEIASTECDSVDKMISTEIQGDIQKALMKLTDRERNLIAFKFWAELSNSSIAELTGLSKSNVGVILYRAMGRLRTLLEEWGVEYYES